MRKNQYAVNICMYLSPPISTLATGRLLLTLGEYISSYHSAEKNMTQEVSTKKICNNHTLKTKST